MVEKNQTEEEKEYTTEELVAIVNDALLKNRQLQGMVNDLGDKVKSKEIENSSLRTTLGMMQQNASTGGESVETSTEEE